MQMVLEWLGKDHEDTIEITTLESPKYIIIMKKYKQHIPLRSLKKTEWKLLKVVTILNTKRIYFNLVEQCWHKGEIIVGRWSETLLKEKKR